MAVATRTDSTLASTWAQVTLVDAIKTAFTNAGYPVPTSDFTSGTDRVVVYPIAIDSTKAAGTSYLRIRVTNTFVIGQQIFATWNSANNTGTGNSTEVTYTALVANQQVSFTALNGGIEYKFIQIQQGTNVIFLGYLSPANRPTWWDLNTWSYAFIPTANTFALFRSPTVNPYSNTENDSSLNNARMATANTTTARRDFIPGILVFTQSNQGVSGRSSDDLVMVAGSGANRLDILQVPGETKQYLILNPAAGGLAVRVA